MWLNKFQQSHTITFCSIDSRFLYLTLLSLLVSRLTMSLYTISVNHFVLWSKERWKHCTVHQIAGWTYRDSQTWPRKHKEQGLLSSLTRCRQHSSSSNWETETVEGRFSQSVDQGSQLCHLPGTLWKFNVVFTAKEGCDRVRARTLSICSIPVLSACLEKEKKDKIVFFFFKQLLTKVSERGFEAILTFQVLEITLIFRVKLTVKINASQPII